MKRFYFTTRVLYRLDGKPPVIHTVHQGGSYSTERSWKSGLSKLKKRYRESEERTLLDVTVWDTWAEDNAKPLLVVVTPEVEYHFDNEADRYVISSRPLTGPEHLAMIEKEVEALCKRERDKGGCPTCPLFVPHNNNNSVCCLSKVALVKERYEKLGLKYPFKRLEWPSNKEVANNG